MEKKASLDKKEINCLIQKIISGNDNDAWEQLYKQYEAYIHSRAWNWLKDIKVSNPHSLEEDLFSAGWEGFIKAFRRFDPDKGEFTTYATWWIDETIKDELQKHLNSFGFTHSDGVKVSRVYAPKDPEEGSINAYEAELSRAKAKANHKGIVLDDAPDMGSYTSERRTIQILDILKKMTDEEHTLTRNELIEQLSLYRQAKYKNGTKKEASNTFNKTMAEILLEVNPAEYSEDNDAKFKIKYEGYNRGALTERIKYKKGNSNKIELAPVINGLKYVHDFDNDSLDKLIQLVSFSDMLSNEEKKRLIGQLVATASAYYETPFADGDNLRFNPKAVHGRFAQRIGTDRKMLSDNLKIIQSAINTLSQIRFRFNQYTADHEIVPKNDYIHVLSPYHMVVYHDNYYVIGLNQVWGDNKRVLHYRIDLMTDVEIAKDEEGKNIPIEICDFEGLPICNAYWDPEKYMAEHINMAYGETRDIRIKINADDHTILHDWFGNHYTKNESVTETDGFGKEIQYDIVTVRTSPGMIVHWAMQYGTVVEIMDDEIRERIREEVHKMSEMYSNRGE